MRGGRWWWQGLWAATVVLLAGFIGWNRFSAATEGGTSSGPAAVSASRPEAATDSRPASRPAARRAGVALVDWATVVQSHPDYSRLEQKFAGRRAEIQALTEAGETEKARELSAETEQIRKEAVANLFKDIDGAIKLIADRDHYDVVTGQVVFLQDGVEVPDITTETLENLRKITAQPESRPAATQTTGS